MKREWKEYFQLWAEREEFKKKVKRSHERVERAECHNPAILFSGGKDSTVGLHIVLQHYPDILVFHYDYTFNIPRGIEKEIIKNAREIGAKNLIVEHEKYRIPDDRGFFSSVHHFLRDNNIDCVFSCLRVEESARRKAIIKDGIRFQGVKNVHVIAEWTWRDVWAYIVKNKLPYLAVYDKYAELEGWDRARFTAFFSQDLDFLGKSNVDGYLMWRWKGKLS